MKKNRLKFLKNRTEPKPEKTRAKPVFILKHRTETGRFKPISVFLKNMVWLFCFYKNQTNKTENNYLAPHSFNPNLSIYSQVHIFQLRILYLYNFCSYNGRRKR